MLIRYETALFRLTQLHSSPTQARWREEDLVSVYQRNLFAATPPSRLSRSSTKSQLSLSFKTQLSTESEIIFSYIS